MKEELDPNKKTILVIDDEKPIIDILVYNLKKEGYNTLEATDGEMGLDMAVKLRPNLILLDVMLPKIDGRLIEKSRYLIPLDGKLTAELDIFEGDLAPLIIVEVEFDSLDAANSFIPPEWFGEDVTESRKYHNSNLALS